MLDCPFHPEPLAYVIEPELHRIRLMLFRLDLAAIECTASDALAARDGYAGYDVLLDCRPLTHITDTALIIGLSRLWTNSCLGGGHRRWAVVTDSEHSLGMTRMFEMLTDTVGCALVCRSTRGAGRWLETGDSPESHRDAWRREHTPQRGMDRFDQAARMLASEDVACAAVASTDTASARVGRDRAVVDYPTHHR